MALILASYGVVAALQPISEFGRVYAAYGEIFIALALLWGSVLLEEARVIARNLAYHRRAKVEARLELLLLEIERQIEELRTERG